ncbi:MAG: 50S ribosomal protein L9 [Armatimonadetes bacterium]|nr:50S ribosomal protein L9 [Armatimonadota bacterium]
MEVILLQDVESLGHEGDVVRVADGHARNYLIPRKIAVPATKDAKQQLERRRGAIAKREEQKAEAAHKVAERLHEHPLVVMAKAGEGGKLHGSVTAQQIVEALGAQTGVSLDRRRIGLLEPIREVGDYLVSAEVYKGVTAQLTIRVVSQAGAEAEAEEPEEEAEDEAADGEADGEADEV